MIKAMGRTGQGEAGSISAQTLLYGRRVPRELRDAKIDGENPGPRARGRAREIMDFYRKGDLESFVLGLESATSDPGKVPDEDQPLLLGIYRETAQREVKLQTGALVPDPIDEAELKGLENALRPTLHKRIRRMQDLLANPDINLADENLLRGSDLEYAAFLVPGKLSDFFSSRLATSSSPLTTSRQTRQAIIRGQAVPAAEEAFHEALRRMIVEQANMPRRGLQNPGDGLELSELAAYTSQDSLLHIRSEDGEAVCGVNGLRSAKWGSWRDVTRPGSTWKSCPVCSDGAGTDRLEQIQAERSDTSPRLEGHPALRGQSVDDFIDGIARSAEVQLALRNSLGECLEGEGPEEPLLRAINRQLVEIDPA